jgi:hypothetical protein
VRRGEWVGGPYPAAQVTRYAILGRILASDEVSQDAVQWVPLADRPELLPECLRGTSDESELLRLRLREDERNGFDRRDGQIPSREDVERRSGRERRQPEPPEVIARRRRRTLLVRGLRGREAEGRPLWIGLAALSVGVVALALLGLPTRGGGGASCNADPAPGVNWQNCRLERLDVSNRDLGAASLRNARARGANMAATRLRGADLAYAELVGASLKGADLAGASLVGANLQEADFGGAGLKGADLAYADLYRARLGGADLSGARLDRAIWVDGSLCLPGSLGACRTH